jgi:hypothetical protein
MLRCLTFRVSYSHGEIGVTRADRLSDGSRNLTSFRRIVKALGFQQTLE